MDAKNSGCILRKHERQMTQSELAEKIRVTDKAVSRWERGLGFPDINTLEPLADALRITLIELMQSEKSGKTDMCIDDASGVVVDTIEIAENQIRKDRQQEKQIIIVTALISVFILLIDQIGWSVENNWFTGTGVVLPVMFFCLFLLALFGFPGQN